MKLLPIKISTYASYCVGGGKVTEFLSWAIVIGIIAFAVYEVYSLIKGIKDKKSKKKTLNKDEEKKQE